ncbi:uncharacterized protein LOC112523196 isoform X2 [Cynara cardunculus var. scolymus]|uniref:uncharacterized protein LOC112523196 isoform X1 n=1 Tax=Cynara cardunculus var. scolymus TaxID=59895 RepID=UPI000D6258A9|nr:uncharacterized protein LOC112523196 isoform X1 [Cynara cardunculus var. scolymus]XP_024988475.1 uncharacterized protein LOC112523196 isoform X2 [Cynara cardunculus var. scolymus]
MATTFETNQRNIFTTDQSSERSIDAVSDFLTEAVNSFFPYIIGVFNHWLDVAMPYLIGVAVLYVCICCLSFLFSVVRFFFTFIGRCLRFGRRDMRAPGRPSKMISRDAFRKNPSGYFRDLRGKPNDFVY